MEGAFQKWHYVGRDCWGKRPPAPVFSRFAAAYSIVYSFEPDTMVNPNHAFKITKQNGGLPALFHLPEQFWPHHKVKWKLAQLH